MQQSSVQWMPSKVEGALGISGATVFPDRIELRSESGTIVHRFAEIAQWPFPRFVWRALAGFGMRPRWLPVGDRDWFHSPENRFFRFYTHPPVTVYCEPEPEDMAYSDTLFFRIQDVMRSGG